MPSSDTQFKKGNKSKGRPKGARNKFTHDFINTFCKDFAEHGSQAVEKVRLNDTVAYLRTGSQLITKDVDVKHSGDVTINIVDYKDD